MSFAFRAIYNCCWNMFIRRTIYWIVIPCAKLQKIFGITIKLGNNFGVWWGLRLFDWGSREGLNLVWVGLKRELVDKNRKKLLVVVHRSFVAHVAVLCACECKRASILSLTKHQQPFGLWTTTRTINLKNIFSITCIRKWFSRRSVEHYWQYNTIMQVKLFYLSCAQKCFWA